MLYSQEPSSSCELLDTSLCYFLSAYFSCFSALISGPSSPSLFKRPVFCSFELPSELSQSYLLSEGLEFIPYKR
ncbi:hypothetical protein FGO68_gene16665 [Halteria grandinella]|uniref:Uncharacterized protein n=1 Tax=Halteria grandinella TaxID=5974 RepID=A0A8J8T9Z1_HALGN|nr:hypothetical protein FGO68_gene16665 [Halteria grandinella]